MAKAYAAQGRSVLDDARAAGVSEGLIQDLCRKALKYGELKLAAAGDGTIFDSLCAVDDAGSVQWEGCTTRYRISDTDTTWNYGIDDGQAPGHETSSLPWLDLHAGGIKHSYNSINLDIIKASPASDIPDVANCYTQSFGLTVAGFGASTGGTVCPSRWSITKTSILTTPEYHKVQWEGETNDDREAIAVTGYKIKQGQSTNFTLTVNWDVH